MGRPLHQHVVPETYVQLLFEYLQVRGHSPEAVLGSAWPQSDPDGLGGINVELWDQMLQRAAAHLADPLVSLHVGQTITSQNLGILGAMLLASESVGAAMQRFERYQRLIYDVVPIRLQVREEWFELVWDFSQYTVGRLVEETGYSVLLQFGRSLVREPLRPLQVRFAHAQPVDVRSYEEFFGCPVLFGQLEPGVRFGVHLLATPLRSPDRGLIQLLEQRADALLGRLPVEDEIVERLRKIISEALREGEPDIERISAKMSCSSRTLQRRLAEVGTSFREELNFVRHELAEAYLREPRLQIVEIALLLGYSEHSAFTRAFKEWTGHTPQEARQRYRPLTNEPTPHEHQPALGCEIATDMGDSHRIYGTGVGQQLISYAASKRSVSSYDLARLAKVALACGFEIDDLLQDIGVSASGSADPECLWDWQQVSRLYEAGIRRATQAHFPFMLGEHFLFDRAPEVEAYLATCTTLRDTLVIYDYLPYLIQSDLMGWHEVDRKQAHFYVEMQRNSRFMEVPGFIETIFVVILRLIREAPWSMSVYEVSFRGQPMLPMEAYVKQYGVAPHFGAPNNRISLPQDLLDKPLRGRSPILHAQSMLALEDRLRRLTARSGLAKAVEMMMLQAPYITMQEVCQSMGMEQRSLQRRLKEADTSFNVIQAKARFHLAQLMLSNRGLDMDSIALKLGFSDSNGFSKAFSKWSGMPPSQFRKIHIK